MESSSYYCVFAKLESPSKRAESVYLFSTKELMVDALHKTLKEYFNIFLDTKDSDFLEECEKYVQIVQIDRKDYVNQEEMNEWEFLNCAQDDDSQSDSSSESSTSST